MSFITRKLYAVATASSLLHWSFIHSYGAYLIFRNMATLLLYHCFFVKAAIVKLISLSLLLLLYSLCFFRSFLFIKNATVSTLIFHYIWFPAAVWTECILVYPSPLLLIHSNLWFSNKTFWHLFGCCRFLCALSLHTWLRFAQFLRFCDKESNSNCWTVFNGAFTDKKKHAQIISYVNTEGIATAHTHTHICMETSPEIVLMFSQIW